MRPFSTGDLSRMQAVQEAAMQDTCEMLEYITAGRDDGGKSQFSYVSAGTSICGFQVMDAEEVVDGAEIAAANARIRLPIDTDIDNDDRIRITHRFGVELDEQPVFEIVGEPLRGPSGLVLNLKRAVDGSNEG